MSSNGHAVDGKRGYIAAIDCLKHFFSEKFFKSKLKKNNVLNVVDIFSINCICKLKRFCLLFQEQFIVFV